MRYHYSVNSKVFIYNLDAKESIACDETFVKGYFRKGSAHVALAQLDQAVKDFK